jgi:pimeloyl-ACP methyl ester carboxylesterase
VIAWEESGSGSPIVFVHGITEDKHAWHSVVPHLEDSFRCIRLDLRGHGESSDAEDYVALAMAGDIATVVDDAHVDEPPLVVGHSLGGVVVTAYAASGPVRGVVNVDQPLHALGFAALLQSIGEQLRGPAFTDTFIAISDALMSDRMSEEDRAWADAKHRAARQDVVLGIWGLLLDSPPDETQALIDSMLTLVTAPYLAIHGSNPGDDYPAWLKSKIPSATFEIWDGNAHYPHMVEPERFAARVREFALSSS